MDDKVSRRRHGRGKQATGHCPGRYSHILMDRLEAPARNPAWRETRTAWANRWYACTGCTFRPMLPGCEDPLDPA